MANPLTRHLAAQSVHVFTHPAPRSLSESKLVLSALQKYGEVVTFRNLKYDKTNTNPLSSKNTIVVFESPQAAKTAIANSPLKIPLKSSSSSLSANSSSNTSSSSSSSSSPSPSPSPSTSTSTSTNPSPSPSPSHSQPPCSSPTTPSSTSTSISTSPTLTIYLQPSHHNHISSLPRNPCYGSFTIDKESYQALDLRQTGIPVQELADVPVRWKLAQSAARQRGVDTRGVTGGERTVMGGASLWRMFMGGNLGGENGGEDGGGDIGVELGEEGKGGGNGVKDGVKG